LHAKAPPDWRGFFLVHTPAFQQALVKALSAFTGRFVGKTLQAVVTFLQKKYANSRTYEFARTNGCVKNLSRAKRNFTVCSASRQLNKP
jgi:hypothetical protein